MYTNRYSVQLCAKIVKFLFLACAILTSFLSILSFFFCQVCLSHVVFEEAASVLSQRILNKTVRGSRSDKSRACLEYINKLLV